MFVLNCKDHIRRGELERVVAWHADTLAGLGFTVVDRMDVRCPGNRYGANRHLRMEHESVVAFRYEVTA